jgi:hypothetical protein
MKWPPLGVQGATPLRRGVGRQLPHSPSDKVVIISNVFFPNKGR